MESFFSELKRRHIYRVAAAYAVVAWLLLQIVNNLTPVMRLPDWAGSFVVLVLILGFPLAIFFAWIRVLPPADVSRPIRVTAMDGALIGVLLVVLAAISYEQLAPSQPVALVQQASVEAARHAAASPAGAISIAVLPFENLSADPDQEFFSAGMTEEITSALAKIPDLHVVARTSAFQFKDQKRDIRAIAEALHATHFVEGSVRKSGARLRITAQLINAESGVSIWADNYDREYRDVFAIQEDIATAIAGALRMPLGLQPGERLVNNRTNDLKAYEDYLRVRVIGALVFAVPNATATLEQAVARDPNFAPAWASLATRYITATINISGRKGVSVDEVQSLLDTAEKAARRAIELDPSYAAGYSRLGQVQRMRVNWAEAEKLIEKALVLDPNDPETLLGYAGFLSATGRIKQALPPAENFLRLEPLIPASNVTAAVHMYNNGQVARATAILEPLNISTLTRNRLLAEIYASNGEYSKAADTLLLINDNAVSRQVVEDAARLLRTAPAKVDSPQSLPDLPAQLNFVYAYIGALDRLKDFPDRLRELGREVPNLVWSPTYAPLRKTDWFKTLVRDGGLVAYWRTKGWPNLCHPTPADDFECE